MTKRHPKPTEDQKIGRIVRRAADLIEDRGWVKNQAGNKNLGFCVLGSLASTGAVNSDASLAMEKLETWLRENAIIPRWNGASPSTETNDRVAKDKEEVLIWMRKAADEMDPQWI